MSDLTDMAERSMSELEIDEAEQGSSEETLEAVTNVSTRPFSHIAACQYLQQKMVDKRSGSGFGEITGFVLLSDGQAVICQPSDRQLRVLGKNWETKLNLQMKSYTNYSKYSIDSMVIALFDRKRVAVAISCTWQRTEGELEENTFINILTVSPSVKLGPEMKRKYRCGNITCFNNKIYCYSYDLNISTMIYCPGIEILSQTGDLLKTIELFDQVSCFCPSKDGNILYFGSRMVDNSVSTFFKCVTADNTEVFQYPTLLEPKFAVSDTQGNVIILSSAGEIVLLNPDGSEKRVILHRTNIKAERVTSMCYSDINNTILLAGSDNFYVQLMLYQLQYSQ